LLLLFTCTVNGTQPKNKNRIREKVQTRETDHGCSREEKEKKGYQQLIM